LIYRTVNPHIKARTTMKTRASSNIAVLAWSGGKDSALALEALQKEKRIRITRLLTTITKDYDSMITRDKNT